MLPRLVIAGGPDDIRAALAAELVDTWNDIPDRYLDFHRPIEMMPSTHLESNEEVLKNGGWVVHSNQFTRRQARGVACATQVIGLLFENTQVDEQGMTLEKCLMRNRERITRRASRYHVPLRMLGVEQDLYTDISSLLSEQRLYKHAYTRHLRDAVYGVSYTKNRPI